MPKLENDPEDLQALLDVLFEQRASLKQRVENLREQQKEVEAAWLSAQNELDKARGAGKEIQENLTALLTRIIHKPSQ